MRNQKRIHTPLFSNRLQVLNSDRMPVIKRLVAVAVVAVVVVAVAVVAVVAVAVVSAAAAFCEIPLGLLPH
jgi:predicted ABC-type exoprotein transport system permease subunit